LHLPAFAAAFRAPGFRRLWIGAFLSSVGTWTQDVALAWLVHQRFGDPRYLGYRSFAAEAPLLAFMLLGGARADRGDRKKILLGSQVAQMACAVALALMYATDTLSMAAILVLAVLAGLAQSQSAPTYQATLTSLVPRAHIQSAVGLNSLQFNLSRALGPAVAAVLLASAGAGVCFGVNALSFVAVIIAIAGLDLPKAPVAPAESVLKSLSLAWDQVSLSPQLRVLVLLGAAGSLLGFPFITYLPVVASRLGEGAAGFGLLMASFGAGAIVGAVVTAQQGPKPGRGIRTLIAFACCGAGAAGAAASPWAWLTACLLPFTGFAMVVALSTVNSLVQENAPDAFRGRVLAIFGLAFRGGGPIGSLAAGFLVKAFGVAPVLAAFGACLAIFSAIVFWKGSAFRRL
jgi:MFS family permease